MDNSVLDHRYSTACTSRCHGPVCLVTDNISATSEFTITPVWAAIPEYSSEVDVEVVVAKAALIKCNVTSLYDIASSLGSQVLNMMTPIPHLLLSAGTCRRKSINSCYIAPAAIDQPARPAAAVDRRDRQTDGRTPDHYRPCFVYFSVGFNNNVTHASGTPVVALPDN